MLSIWKSKFNLKELSFTVDEPEVFVTCQWQTNRIRANVWYLIYRWLVSIYFLTTWILAILDVKPSDPAWYQAKYAIYLTNWGYTLCTFQALLAAVMITLSMLKYRRMEFSLTPVQKIYKIYWLLNVIATPVAFVITVIYWTAIYDAKKAGFQVINLIVHGLNSVVMFFDFWMLSHPVRLIHFVYPVLFASIYVAFTVIYFLAGGTSREGYTYIYPILDWNKVPKSIMVIIIVGLFAIFLHVVIYFMHLGRTKIYEKLIGSKNDRHTFTMREMNDQRGYVNEAVTVGDEV